MFGKERSLQMIDVRKLESLLERGPYDLRQEFVEEVLCVQASCH